MKKIIELLKVLSDAKFWGEVTIRFREGQPIVMDKKEQIKITE